MNIFQHKSYKDFLRSYLKENKQKGVISQVAEICGCDRTYLSQVLNGKAELTPDHMVRFYEYLSLGEAERQYLLFLLLKDRASSKEARKLFQEKLDKLKREALALSQKIATQEELGAVEEKLRTTYYSQWLYGAVHILVSIPKYQTPSALAEKLNISMATINKVLRDLVEMKVVRKEKDRFLHHGTDVYLGREAPQMMSHHFNWRMKALERSMVKEDVHYTTAFSISLADVENIRNQIVELIEKQRKLVAASGTDAAYVFCCDYFEI